MKNFVQQGASARADRGGSTTLLIYRTIAIFKILRNIIIEKPPLPRTAPRPRAASHAPAPLALAARPGAPGLVALRPRRPGAPAPRVSGEAPRVSGEAPRLGEQASQ